MSDDLFKDTVKLQVTRKVGTDGRGRTVWTKPVAPIELELVSPEQLQQMLASGDEHRNERLQVLADGDDGVLARHSGSFEFEILSEDELHEALKAAGGESKVGPDADAVLEPLDDVATVGELSLVTTQMLRRVFGKGTAKDEQAGGGKIDDLGGFNPYDKS